MLCTTTDFDKRHSESSAFPPPLPLTRQALRRQRRILDPEKQVWHHTLIRAKDGNPLDRSITKLVLVLREEVPNGKTVR